jgi:transcriptional regulator with XRE-family HTH domain
MATKNGMLAIFAKRIGELRKNCGWSQGDLAKKLGTSAAIAGRYERGEVAPSIEVARKIADALGVTLDYLTDPDASAVAIQDQETLDRLHGIQRLPSEERQRIIDVIDALMRDANARATYTDRKPKKSA